MDRKLKNEKQAHMALMVTSRPLMIKYSKLGMQEIYSPKTRINKVFKDTTQKTCSKNTKEPSNPSN